MPQMHLGVDIANSWLPSGRSSVRNTRTALTPLWPRWTPQPTRSKRLKSIASPRLNSSPQEMSARWVLLEDQADKQRHMCLVLYPGELQRSPAPSSTPSSTGRPPNLWITGDLFAYLDLTSLPSSKEAFMTLNLAVSAVRRNPSSLAFAGVWFFRIPSWWPHAYIKCAEPAAALRRSSFWATLACQLSQMGSVYCVHTVASPEDQYMVSLQRSMQEGRRAACSGQFGQLELKVGRVLFNEQPVNWQRDNVKGHLRCPNA